MTSTTGGVAASGWNRAVAILSGLAAVLGLLVLAGWHTQNARLIQVYPGSTPMAYNTAVSFVLLGGALLAPVRGFRVTARLGAAAAGVLIVLSLVEYVSGLSLGASTLLARFTLPAGAQEATPVAPNTAMALVSLAIAMLLLSTRRGSRWWRQAEKARRESEAAFRALADAVPQIVWICTPDGLNVYFNQRWVDYTGLTLAESYGRGWNTPYHQDDKQAAWNAWNHATETGETYSIESRLRAADGSYRWYLMRGVPLRDAAGRIVKWFGTCTEIHELKQAEESLRNLNDKLRQASDYNRSLIEASLDPLVTIAPDGKITDLNRATEQATGLSRQALIGTDFCDYFTDRERARAGYQRVFQGGGTQDYDLEIRRPDGSTIPVLYNASRYRNQAGEIEGVFAAARDITERKRVEGELKELNASLERRVAERTADLVAVNQELESFNYSVSHDLRAPLRHIDGFSKILVEEYGPQLPDTARRYLGTICDGAKRMGRMVDELLELSRTSRKELSRQPTGLASLVQDVLTELRPETRARQIEWRIGELPFVDCDPHLIQQVFANLLANAVKFTRPRKPAVIEVGQEQVWGSVFCSCATTAWASA